MQDPFIAVTCSEELEKQRNMKLNKGIDLAASVITTKTKNKNKVAEFRDRLMRGF